MWSIIFAQEKPATTVDPMHAVNGIWNTVREYLATQGTHLVINLLLALLIFLVGKWVTNILSRFCNRLMKQAKVDDTLARFLANIVYAVLMVMVILATLARLGINTTSMAAVVAAAGFAVGMALQGSLGNFAAGVMLIVFRPFKMGDFVEAGGVMGTVEEIALFSTILKTPDNRRVIVPNGEITNGVITNNSHNPTRRIDLVIGCAYGDDLLAVKSFLNDVIDEDPRILDDPEPQVAVSELGESSVNFIVRPWVKTSDYADVKYALTERIKLGFDQRGFNFPFPSRDVYTHAAG